MFEFFIALFGSLYYGGRYIWEKSKSLNADLAIANSRLSESNFAILHTDFAMEYKIRNQIDDSKEHEELWHRVSEVLHSLEHWKGYSRRDFNLSTFETRRMVYDILLADRGKIFSDRLSSGYFEYRLPIGYRESCNTNSAEDERHREYVEWLGQRIKEQGSDAHLVRQLYICGGSEYAWQGSLYYNPTNLLKVIT